MNAGERANGFRDGMRYAVSWLHERAKEMNDPWAKSVLNAAAFNLGVVGKQSIIEAKAKLLEIALSRAAALPTERAAERKEGRAAESPAILEQKISK